MCVCLSVYLYSRTTRNEAACERYTRLQRSKRSKNNVADLAKTAAFWQEKPAPPWTKFRDPTHQLVRCACVFITRLGACSTGSAAGGTHCPETCVAVNDTLSAASLLQNRCIRYQGVYIPHGSSCRSCVIHLLALRPRSSSRVLKSRRGFAL